MYKNLVQITCADKIEYFCRMRDFFCQRNGTYDYSTTGIGWTLHDSSYAVDEDNPEINDWFVIYSAGESTDEDMYMLVTWVSGYIKIIGYQYWNNSTHAGVKNYNTANNHTLAEAGSPVLSVYGDLDFVYVFGGTSQVFFGKIQGLGDDTVATSAGTVSAGTDVTITVDAVPASWAVDGKIYIRDNALVEILTIKTISGNDITADVANSYAAGCKLQGEVNYCVNTSTTSQSAYTFVGHLNINTVNAPAYTASFHFQVDPDALYDEFIGSSIFLAGSSTYVGILPNMVMISKGTTLTSGDLLTGTPDNYRYFVYGTVVFTAIREV